MANESMQLSAELFSEIVRHLKGTLRDGRDKRTAPRVGLRNRVMLLPTLAGDKNSVPRSVRVRDLSPLGIGLVDDRPMHLGTHFAIRLPLSGRPDLTAIYTVKHCATLAAGLFGIGGLLQKVQDPGAILMAAKSA